MGTSIIFDEIAQELGYGFDGEIKIGGNYAPLIEHEGQIHISGQIPRVGDVVMVTGCVGAETTLAQAQHAAKICIMRAIALLQQHLGDLDQVKKVLRMTVYVHSAAGFTQHSEVADGASEVLFRVFGERGRHTRTSVGAYNLPKNAAVELDLCVAVGS